jgi:hypothetical protein
MKADRTHKHCGYIWIPEFRQFNGGISVTEITGSLRQMGLKDKYE